MKKDDLIKRQDALNQITAIDTSIIPYTRAREYVDELINYVIKIIDSLPSAEPERKGEWVLYESRSDIYDLEGVCTWGRAYRCSECGFIHWVIEDFGIYSFCPNCGADMRGEDGKA